MQVATDPAVTHFALGLCLPRLLKSLPFLRLSVLSFTMTILRTSRGLFHTSASHQGEDESRAMRMKVKV